MWLINTLVVYGNMEWIVSYCDYISHKYTCICHWSHFMNGILIVLKLVKLSNQPKMLKHVSDFLSLVLLDKSKKTIGLSISSGVHGHRDRSETGRHWIIGAQQGLLWATWPHPWTHCLCYFREGERKEGKGAVLNFLFTPLDYLTQPETALQTFIINLIICSHVQKSQNSHSELRLSWHEPMFRGKGQKINTQAAGKNASFEIVFSNVFQCY